MMKKIVFATIISVSSLALFSCKKMLDTKPKNAIDLDAGVKDPSVLAGFLNGIYNEYQAAGYYGRDYIIGSELMGDNAEITANNSNRLVNQANNTPSSHIGEWLPNYRNIYKANLVIKFAEGSGASTTEVNRLMGEAYFLRAMNYFDLVKTYARNPQHLIDGFDLGVPLITDAITNASNATFPSRAKVSEVYNLILSDLDKAATFLTNANAPKRASKAAALALASRVNLYKGDYDKAESFATQALASGVGTFVNDSATFVNKWGNGHPESIFELNYEQNEAMGSDAMYQFVYKDPVTGGYGDATARLGLINAMDTTQDKIRYKGLILRTKKVGTSQTVYVTRKFTGKKGSSIDDIMLIRVSELYLNRAEARALKTVPDVIGALADVNKVRTRGGFLPALTGLTGQALVDAIRNERRVELAFEGHRLWDLLRYGQDFVKTTGTPDPPTPPNTFTVAYSSFYLIAPIPQSELDVNKNLAKNPGY